MKLYQTFKKDKHFYWSVASNFLQAGGRPVFGELTERLWPPRKKGGKEKEKEKEKETDEGGQRKEEKPPAPSADLKLLYLCEAMIAKRFAEHPPTHVGSTFPCLHHSCVANALLPLSSLCLFSSPPSLLFLSSPSSLSLSLLSLSFSPSLVRQRTHVTRKVQRGARCTVRPSFRALQTPTREEEIYRTSSVQT